MKIPLIAALLLLTAIAAACGGGPVQQACGNDYDTEECYDAIGESISAIEEDIEEEYADCDEAALALFSAGDFLNAAYDADSDANRGEYDPDTLRTLHQESEKLADAIRDAC